MTPGAAVGQQAGTGIVRVVVSGWQVYDNKGKVVEKYEPYFGTGWDYASSEGRSEQKVRMYYDPRGQLIRTVSPDGSEQRVIFGVPVDLSDPDIYAPLPTGLDEGTRARGRGLPHQRTRPLFVGLGRIVAWLDRRSEASSVRTARPRD